MLRFHYQTIIKMSGAIKTKIFGKCKTIFSQQARRNQSATLP